jgi:hypothetical protein
MAPKVDMPFNICLSTHPGHPPLPVITSRVSHDASSDQGSSGVVKEIIEFFSFVVFTAF